MTLVKVRDQLSKRIRSWWADHVPEAVLDRAVSDLSEMLAFSGLATAATFQMHQQATRSVRQISATAQAMGGLSLRTEALFAVDQLHLSLSLVDPAELLPSSILARATLVDDGRGYTIPGTKASVNLHHSLVCRHFTSTIKQWL